MELGVVEQQCRARWRFWKEGAPVTEAARRYGLARQTVHACCAAMPLDNPGLESHN